MGGQTAHTVTRAGPRLALFFFFGGKPLSWMWRGWDVRERKKNSTCSFCTLPEQKKLNREAHIWRTVMYGWVFPRSFHSRRSNHNAGRHCFTSSSAQTYLSQKVPSPRSRSAHFSQSAVQVWVHFMRKNKHRFCSLVTWGWRGFRFCSVLEIFKSSCVFGALLKIFL